MQEQKNKSGCSFIYSIQRFREMLSEKAYRTIPKANLGHDQYTVPDTVVVEPTFVAFI